MSVVREDVVRLTFDFETQKITQSEGSIEDLLELTQKLGGAQGTGKAEDGFDDAAKAAKEFGKTRLNKLSDGLDSIAKSVGQIALKMGGLAIKGIAVGAAAGVAGVAALTNAAIQGYAEYEQLVGGVETLFGTGGMTMREYAESINQSTDSIKDFQREHGLVVDGIIGKNTAAAMEKSYRAMEAAEKAVLTNANNAYKTAGLSANEYMETVTSFSASLIQSLGGDTQKAATLADQAIIDMSDNANKMGTDMTMIQNAYQGFAKQNYTMLDNLNTLGALVV